MKKSSNNNKSLDNIDCPSNTSHFSSSRHNSSNQSNQRPIIIINQNNKPIDKEKIKKIVEKYTAKMSKQNSRASCKYSSSGHQSIRVLSNNSISNASSTHQIMQKGHSFSSKSSNKSRMSINSMQSRVSVKSNQSKKSNTQFIRTVNKQTEIDKITERDEEYLS